ncbi:MAG: sigma-70 family RNA polymerase sigma factor [Pseudomonadota bacterium]
MSQTQTIDLGGVLVGRAMAPTALVAFQRRRDDEPAGLVRDDRVASNRGMVSTKPNVAPRGRAKWLDDLLVAVAGGDRSAFVELFDHFAPRVKSYLIRLGCDMSAAEEIGQEVMVTVWRRAETFDRRQASASTWMFTIARNKRIDMVRRERRPELDPTDPAMMPEPEITGEKAVQKRQETQTVVRAIAELPDEQKTLLQMAYYEDKPHSVIAAETGLPLGTVKSRLRLALNRLRKIVKED